jgi:hypothetical protein
MGLEGMKKSMPNKNIRPGFEQGVIKRQEYPKITAWVWFVGGMLLLALWGGVVWLLIPASQAHGTVNSLAGAVIFSNTGQEHREDDVTYKRDVPVAGPHNAAWLNCGIYDKPVPEKNVVHSLEHGSIWLAYRPDLPTDQVELLRDLVRQEQRRSGKPLLILAPRPDLDVPLVVTAWQVQLKLDDTSDERLMQFLRRYRVNPFAPEPGAGCTGGVGQPID